MRRYKISEALLAGISNVLTRRGIDYEIKNEDNQYYCYTTISGKQFHKCVIRAKCEKITKDRGSTIPFIAFSEIEDDLVKQEIGNVYMVLEKEQ